MRGQVHGLVLMAASGKSPPSRDINPSVNLKLTSPHRVELHPGDYVTVSASRYPFANVLPEGRHSEDWVHSISKTLNWNSRTKQKAFVK